MICEHCNMQVCPVLNKSECPINKLWERAREAQEGIAEMEAKDKAIPTFNSEDEEREFWATHDGTDYVDTATPVILEYDEEWGKGRMTDKRLLTPEDERLLTDEEIVSARFQCVCSVGYPVSDRKATELANYVAKTQLAKVDKARPDREKLREKFAKLLRCQRNCGYYPSLCLKPSPSRCRVAIDEGDYEWADQIIALVKEVK